MACCRRQEPEEPEINLDHIIPIDMHSYNQKSTYPASSSNAKNESSESDDTRGTPFEEANLPSTVPSENDHLLEKKASSSSEAQEKVSAPEASPKSSSKASPKSSSSPATSSFANISSDDEEEVRESAEQMMELDTDDNDEEPDSSHV